MSFQVIDDGLYAQVDQHIFLFDPATGKEIWHRNLSTDLRLKFYGEICGGMWGEIMSAGLFASLGTPY